MCRLIIWDGKSLVQFVQELNIMNSDVVDTIGLIPCVSWGWWMVIHAIEDSIFDFKRKLKMMNDDIVEVDIPIWAKVIVVVDDGDKNLEKKNINAKEEGMYLYCLYAWRRRFVKTSLIVMKIACYMCVLRIWFHEKYL